MKYYAFKNIRNGRYISGTDFNRYPFRQILADEYKRPLILAEFQVAGEVIHRGINLKTYKVVAVEIQEVKNVDKR